MKRFKLSRKEKLLFVTPLLVPLLVWAWPIGKTDSFESFERRLQELAGPQAVDCGFTPGQKVVFYGTVEYEHRIEYDLCTIKAFKTGKPFIVRQGPRGPANSYRMGAQAMVKTPQGQIYWMIYERSRWLPKASIIQIQVIDAKIDTSPAGAGRVLEIPLHINTIKDTSVWW